MPSLQEAALARLIRSVSSSFRNQEHDADIVYDRKVQPFWPNKKPQRYNSSSEDFLSPRKNSIEDPRESYESSGKKSPETDFLTCESRPSSPISIELHKSNLLDRDKYYDAEDHCEQRKGKKKKIRRGESFSVIAPTKMETKQFILQGQDADRVYGDKCTVGSISKSSFECRSSIYCRNSENEDPFSSSSRSCPKWESYTVFQKYDEMSFPERTGVQNLHETESLGSIQVCPRSMSERIVHRFEVLNKNPADIRHNPYHELEAAYVAQICLTWEALNWNYMNFQSKTASLSHIDLGCPARIAHQFQQFQDLLQKYIENETYEHGRRPEIYARMRLLAPKLLVVPEYKDDDEDGCPTRISSATFLLIMEDGIRTFMNFLEADKENPGHVFAAYFKRNRRSLVDPSFLSLMKKVNRKKTVKLKALCRGGKVLRRRKLKEEEMKIFLGLIDLKVVSRVLRMIDLAEVQLHWCEKKMSKVRVLHGELQRDVSPLFFPV